jgi:hypothetical protein
MRKLALLAVIGLLVFACKQGETRYTQSSAEIDTYKAMIAAYEGADWDNYTAKFADTAKIYHNTDDKSMTPAETVETHKTNTAALSSYGFVSDKGDVEMVISDKGETWVNYWGLWKGTIASNGKEMMIPVHITAQFVDGKVVREYGYWDNAPMQAVMEAAAAAEAAEEAEGASENASEVEE